MAEPFTLQLHITDACPLRCRHCYRDAAHGELPLPILRRMLDDFTAFCDGHRLVGRVTFAGGEPLLRLDDLLRLSRHARDSGHQVHLLTNGALLSPATIAELRSAGCLRLQVSLDGDEPAHDSLRGPGAFARAVAALEMLKASGMPRTISMTLGRWNVHCLPPIIQVARDCDAKLFVARFVPCGTGLSMRNQLLSAEQWRSAMRACHTFASRHPAGVAMRDPLYVPMVCKRPAADSVPVGGCGAGYKGLAVDSDGQAYPCRRLPIPLGRLQTEGLERIWRHPLLESLRDRDQLGGACAGCRWRWRCGGCRAIAHAITQDPLATDPQCPWTMTRPWRKRVTRLLGRRGVH